MKTALSRVRLLLGVCLISLICVALLRSYSPIFKLVVYRPSYQTAAQVSGRLDIITPNLHWGEHYAGNSLLQDVNKVTNSSLGFSKVFVISLPERSDKRDALALAAAQTGFRIEWIDGVKGKEVPNNAVPYNTDRWKLAETNLGSWRGHMNAARRIVEDGLPSALIMEDDADWDVRLKAQLELIAVGSHQVMSQMPSFLFPPKHPSTSQQGHPPSIQRYQADRQSPYGNEWDILWLGHCGEPFPENLPENKVLPQDHPAWIAMSRKFALHKDPTVPPPEKTTGFVDFGASPHTRWVHVTAAPICTFAYALSQRGARHVLHGLSIDGLSGAFDNALSDMCRAAVVGWHNLAKEAGHNGEYRREGNETDAEVGEIPRSDQGVAKYLKCLSVTPPLFFHHRAKGSTSRDSDIQNYGGNGGKNEMREKGSTENIMWSARLNMKNVLLEEDMESQF